MPEPVDRGATLADRLLVPFAERSPAEQAIGGLVIPVLFGAVCGVVLGWSAAAYWVLQLVAALGGVAAGFEHRGARAGAVRGVVGGLLFGAGVLLGHAVAGTDATIDSAAPAFLPVITAVLGSAFGAAGGARRRAYDAGRPAL